MASSLLSSVTGGGGSGVQLAPDLTFPSSINSAAGSITITAIDGSSGLVTALSLSGKFIIDLLKLEDLIVEAITVKLTIDGVVIWNDSFTPTNTDLILLGSDSLTGSGISSASSIACNASLLLELQTATDTDVDLTYLARPVL